MNRHDLAEAGMSAVVNGNGDLYFDAELRHLIGKTVEFQRYTKKGLAEVVYAGNSYYLPPKNLDAQSLGRGYQPSLVLRTAVRQTLQQSGFWAGRRAEIIRQQMLRDAQ